MGGNEVLERIWHSEERMLPGVAFSDSFPSTEQEKLAGAGVKLPGVRYERVVGCQKTFLIPVL